MKKLLILVLSIMFVAGAFTSVVYADHGDAMMAKMPGSSIMMGGDARVRGVCKINFDTNDDADDDNCYWDQRIRFTVTGAIGNAEVRTRFTTENPTDRVNSHSTVWDGATETGGSLNVDYAYLHIPIGSIDIDAGRMMLDFGNKFYVDGVAADKFQVSTKVGDITIGAWTEKEFESNGPDGFFNNDADFYAIFGTYKAGDIAAGALVRYLNDDVADDNNGTDATVYVNTKAAGVGVKGELSLKTGDAAYTANGSFDGCGGTGDEDTQWGGFVSADMGMDAITVGGLFAFTQNGFVADKHFTPTALIGRDNSGAMENFGARGDSLLGVLSASFQAAPELSLGAKVAYADYESYPDNDTDSSSWEIDAGLKYMISKGVTYSIDLGYLIPDDYSASDDNVFGVQSKIFVDFN